MKVAKDLKKKFKERKGITLIALVITIIVLLILAGVSITMLTGDNSILRQATNAKQRTGEGTEAEQVKIAAMTAVADSTVNLRREIDKAKLETELQKYFSGATVTEDGDDYIYEGQYKTYRISKNGTIIEEAPSAVSIQLVLSDTPNIPDPETDDNVKELKDTSVPIPTGFYYVGGIKNEGLVISDAPADENQGVNANLTGNQFVWVPVNQGQTLTLTVTTDETIESIKLIMPDGTTKDLDTTKEQQDIIMTKGGVEGAEYINGIYKVEVKTDKSEKTIEKRISSLYGQDIEIIYEAMISLLKEFGMITNESTREEIMTALTTAGIDIYGFTDSDQQQQSVENYGGFYIARFEAGKENDVLVSKKDKNVYNNATRGQAIVLAKDMYKDNEKNIVAKTQLITGAGWDSTLNWLIETGMSESLIYDSRSWGNYGDSIDDAATNKGSLQTTGKNNAWQAKNIYDLAGNVFEWTNEIIPNVDDNCIYRGGGYNITGANAPVSIRFSTSEDDLRPAIGFRVSLYL